VGFLARKESEVGKWEVMEMVDIGCHEITNEVGIGEK
jgi:hypothetical protein